MFSTLITYSPGRVKVRPIQGKWAVFDPAGRVRGVFVALADAHTFARTITRANERMST